MAQDYDDALCTCGHPRRDHYYHALLQSDVCGWACGCKDFAEA